MIEIKEIFFRYKKKKEDVFNNFSLTLPLGNVCGLLGKNGVGKSTLLYLITGLLRANKGAITLSGHDVTKCNPEILKDIYFVPEEFDMPGITLDEYILRNACFYPNFDIETMKECMKDFDMDMNINLSQLSMGQKKKVYICFALATNVKLLVMDEPTNGLDIPSKGQFRKVIARCMNDTRTILISTHQVKDLELLLDRIIIIDNNKMLLNENVDDINNKLLFTQQSKVTDKKNILFYQSTAIGNNAIIRNDKGVEGNIDLELLFNAMLSEGDKINSILKE